MRSDVTVFNNQYALSVLRVLFWCSLLAIAVLSLLPDLGEEPFFPHQDKVAHALAYIYLYSVGWLAFSAPLLNNKSLLALACRWWLVVGLVTFGIGVELLQGLTGYRSRELADLLANCSGIAIGVVLIRVLLVVGMKYWGWATPQVQEYPGGEQDENTL